MQSVSQDIQQIYPQTSYPSIHHSPLHLLSPFPAGQQHLPSSVISATAHPEPSSHYLSLPSLMSSAFSSPPSVSTTLPNAKDDVTLPAIHPNTSDFESSNTLPPPMEYSCSLITENKEFEATQNNLLSIIYSQQSRINAAEAEITTLRQEISNLRHISYKRKRNPSEENIAELEQLPSPSRTTSLTPPPVLSETSPIGATLFELAQVCSELLQNERLQEHEHILPASPSPSEDSESDLEVPPPTSSSPTRKRRRGSSTREGTPDQSIPYKCNHPTCQKSFKRRPDMLRHARTHDPKQRKYECRACGLRFVRVDVYKKHLGLCEEWTRANKNDIKEAATEN